ncbi:hypothetical protein Tco_0024443 [Tanacetum coccineum]
MDSMHSTLSMYYDYDAHVKGELLVMMKNSQSVNLLIFISNTLIELFNDFGFDCNGIPERPTMYLNLWSYKVVRYRILKDGGGVTIVLKVKEVQKEVSVTLIPNCLFSISDEVLKLKNFKKDATFKALSNQQISRCDALGGPEVPSSQDGKVSRW